MMSGKMNKKREIVRQGIKRNRENNSGLNALRDVVSKKMAKADAREFLEERVMTSEDVAKNLEDRINKHIIQGLDAIFTDKIEWNIEMANKWMGVLSNYRKLQ